MPRQYMSDIIKVLNAMKQKQSHFPTINNFVNGNDYKTVQKTKNQFYKNILKNVALVQA